MSRPAAISEVFVHVRIPDVTRRAIEEAAARSLLTRSAWIRTALLAQLRRDQRQQEAAG